jgi:phosphatidylserine/phosphatidylglycerophosphate/cardiolipin synthase-like enzyme
MLTKDLKIDAIVGKEFSDKVVPLIKDAKRSIKIIVFDWRNYKTDIGSQVFKLNQALLEAVKRGLDVRVIIAAAKPDLKWLKEHFKVKELYTKRVVHSKMMILDDEVLVLGSHNYTYCGLELNHELSVVIRSAAAIERFVEFFDNLF